MKLSHFSGWLTFHRLGWLEFYRYQSTFCQNLLFGQKLDFCHSVYKIETKRRVLKGTKRFEIWNKTVFFLQQWEFETMYEISLPGSCNSNWEIIEANEIRFEELLSLVIIMQKSLSKIYIHFKSLQTSIKVHSTGLSYFRHYVENQRF